MSFERPLNAALRRFRACRSMSYVHLHSVVWQVYAPAHLVLARTARRHHQITTPNSQSSDVDVRTMPVSSPCDGSSTRARFKINSSSDFPILKSATYTAKLGALKLKYRDRRHCYQVQTRPKHTERVDGRLGRYVDPGMVKLGR